MSEPSFTLLLVEDDLTDLALVERAFAKAEVGVTLRSARDGDEAVHYLEGRGPFADRGRYPYPNLVLLDLKLPKRSGFEVLAWLRKQPKLRLTPVVIFTASSEPRDLEEAYRLNANSYIVKPMGVDALLDLVKGVHAYWFGLNRGPQVPGP